MSSHEPKITEKLMQATQAIRTIEENSASSYDFFDWLGKADPHTFITQLIIIVLLISFRNDLHKLVEAIIEKIPELANIGNTGFTKKEKEVKKEIEDEVKEEVDKNLDTAIEKIKSTKAMDENFTMRIWNSSHPFNQFETYLKNLYYIVGPAENRGIKVHRRQMLLELIDLKVLDKEMYKFYRAARRIVFSKRETSNEADRMKFVKAGIFIRDQVKEALDKAKAAQDEN